MRKILTLFILVAISIAWSQTKILPGSQQTQPQLSSQKQPLPEKIKGPGGMTGWKIKLPENRPLATPAVEDGLIFLGGGFGSYQFYALDANSGKITWRIRVNDDGPTGAVVDKGYVAFNTESCILYVVDAKTGKVIWEKWLGDPLLSQPAITDGRVYMAYPGGGKHFLICLGLKDGKEYWKTPIAGEIISAPIIDDGSVYLSTLEGTIYAYDAENGKLQWKDSRNATSAPWVFKGDIYVSQREEGEEIKGKKIRRQYEGFAQICRKTGDQRNKNLWLRREADYLNVDRTSAYAGRQKELDASVGFSSAPASAKIGQAEANLGVASVSGVWAYQGSRPLIHKQRIYSAMANDVECANIKTGKRIWKWSYKLNGKNPGGRALTPPSYDGGKLFFGSFYGDIICLDGKNGELLWKYNCGEAIRFQPAVWKGKVFFTTDNGTVYCLDTKDSSNDGWNMWGGNAQHNNL